MEFRTNRLETGDTGAAVTAESDGALYAAMFGTEQYVLDTGLKFKVDIVSNNQLRVYDGCALMNGRHVRIPRNETESVIVESGTPGMNRTDLLVIKYKKEPSGKESAFLTVLKGNEQRSDLGRPASPTYNAGSILDGTTEVDMPLYEICLNGLNIMVAEPKFTLRKGLGQSMLVLEKAVQDNVKKTETVAKSVTDVQNQCNRFGEQTETLGHRVTNVQNQLNDVGSWDYHRPERLVASVTINASDVIDVPVNGKTHLRVALIVSGTRVQTDIVKTSREPVRIVNYFGGGTAVIVDFKLVSDTQLEIVRVWKDGAWKTYTAQMEIWGV